MVLLLGAATTFAQTSGSSSTGATGTTGTSGSPGTSSSDTSRRGQSGSTGSYDTGSSTGTTGTTSGTTGTGSASSTSAGTATGRDSATSSAKLSWGDRRFVTKAAEGGQSEVQAAQLAAQRATNPDVKTFAQKLVDTHTKVNSELMGLAQQKNVKLDADDNKDRAYNRLNKKAGSEFDQEFVEHMIDEHEKDIKMFEKAASDAKDAEVRAFASKHVSHLRAHLEQAQNLRQSVMPTGRSEDGSARTTPGGTTDSGLGTSSTGTPGTQRDGTSGTTGTQRDSTSGSSTTPRE